MKHAIRLALCLALFGWIVPESLASCTTFVLKEGKGRLFFGRNFDFPTGPGHIHVNLRGAEKISLTTPGERPLTWVAKCGSVSFNQNGREFPYEDSLAYYRSLDGGGLAQISNAHGYISSENRFARAAWLAGSYTADKAEPVGYAFEVLQKVASRATQWSIVFDLEKLAIHFRTTANPRVRMLSVKSFDFACGAKKLLADINKDASTADFQEYTAEANAAMIDAVWDNVEFLKALLEELRKAFADYPQSVRCPEKKNQRTEIVAAKLPLGQAAMRIPKNRTSN